MFLYLKILFKFVIIVGIVHYENCKNSATLNTILTVDNCTETSGCIVQMYSNFPLF
jgi:hypothetical protein